MTMWVQTFGGHAVDLFEPDYSKIRVAHIAHALARIGRFAGNTDTRGEGSVYSVAQHSIMVMSAVRHESIRVQRFALGHDWHEAVIGDITSPVKRALRKIAGKDVVGELEGIHQRAVFDRYFGARPTRKEWVLVVEADLRVLMTEQRDVVGPQVKPWGIGEPFEWKITSWPTAVAEYEVFAAWQRLKPKGIEA